MRLWHQKMIPNLSRQHLLGQHRECAALRGNGWGKKHATVDYVFKYPYYRLFIYHMLIMKQMNDRGYKPDILWFNSVYRGKDIEYDLSEFTQSIDCSNPIYPEHNDKYYVECVKNLEDKGFDISPF